MVSDSITLSRKELENYVRTIVKDEIKKYEFVSLDEQKEIENIYGKKLLDEEFSEKDSISF